MYCFVFRGFLAGSSPGKLPSGTLLLFLLPLLLSAGFLFQQGDIVDRNGKGNLTHLVHHSVVQALEDHLQHNKP